MGQFLENDSISSYKNKVDTIKKNPRKNLRKNTDCCIIFFDLENNDSLTNYDISIVNLDTSDEIVKVIDSITEDTLLDKHLFKGNRNLDNDKSKSVCQII